MTATAEMINDLRQHEALCEELLAVVTSENGGRRGIDPVPAAETFRAKQELLPRLDRSVAGAAPRPALSRNAEEPALRGWRMNSSPVGRPIRGGLQVFW